MFTRRFRFASRPGLFAAAPLLLLALFGKPGKELLVASSPEEPGLVARIQGLAPGVSPDEARLVTRVAVTSGLELAREWKVPAAAALLPGLQNLFISMGTRKRGYCFQYSHELLLRLNALNLRTLDLHWAESQPDTSAENNAIVVTARGQAFSKGVVLDNWRCQGHLAYTMVTKDPDYKWTENKSFAELVLRGDIPSARPKSAPAASRGTAPESPNTRAGDERGARPRATARE